MAERRPAALVVGGGVAGLSVAVALSDAFAVSLVDAGGANASTVAAGMLAPVAEMLGDPLSPPYPLLSDARRLWPAWAESFGAGGALHSCGTLWLGEAAPGLEDDIRLEKVDAVRAAALQPSALIQTGGVFAAEDARVDVGAFTRALHRRLRASGVVVRRSQVTCGENGGLQVEGMAATFAVVVLAPGADAGALAAAAPELEALSPVKGQRIRFSSEAGCATGAMVRSVDGYLAPSGEGAVFGASMAVGVRDCAVDPDLAERQARAAVSLCPALDGMPWTAAAAVRAATADGLPMVGPSASGVLLACGFRRNGWLLAPLAAGMIRAWATGGDPGAWAGALHPGRFAYSRPKTIGMRTAAPPTACPSSVRGCMRK